LKKHKRDHLLQTIDEAVDHLVENQNEKRKANIKGIKERKKITKEKEDKRIAALNETQQSEKQKIKKLEEKLKDKERIEVQYMVKLQDNGLFDSPLTKKQKDKVSQILEKRKQRQSND